MTGLFSLLKIRPMLDPAAEHDERRPLRCTLLPSGETLHPILGFVVTPTNEGAVVLFVPPL